MAENFTTRKLLWLESIARDPRCRGLPLAAAVMLACRYINRRSGQAWPSLATLADDLGTWPANAHAAINKLVETGKLDRQRGRQHRTSRYAIARDWTPSISVSANSDVSASANSGEPSISASANGTRNKNIETREGTPGARRRGKVDDAPPRKEPAPQPTQGFASGQRGRTTRLPEDWQCGPDELAAASGIAGWEPGRARSEFERFLDYHRSEDTRGRSWGRYWRNWCHKGAEIDQRERNSPRRRGGTRESGMLGRRWYDRQQRAAAAAAGYVEDDVEEGVS